MKEFDPNRYSVIHLDAPADEEANFTLNKEHLLQATGIYHRLEVITGLTHFERVCVNIMRENPKPVKPAPNVIAIFLRELYPKYIENSRVDILMENTAFGVGGVVKHAK